MPLNRFTWCDLSTFDVPKAIRFYERIFGRSREHVECGDVHRFGWGWRSGALTHRGKTSQSGPPQDFVRG